MDRCRADIFSYRLPLRQPLTLKQFTLHERQGLILRLRCAERYGYGEIAPLPGFSRESLAQAEAQLMTFCRAVNSGQFQLDRELAPAASLPSVAFGIESALWWMQQDSWVAAPPMAPWLNGTRADILHRLKNWQVAWPGEFKLKTGRSTLESDCVTLEKVLQIVPESVRIRLDANQQWSFAEAVKLGTVIDVTRVAYVEEPTDHSTEFPQLFRQTGLHFALDESVQQADYQFDPVPGLAAIVIKPTLVGGLARCQQLVMAAKTAGIRAVFSSSYESSIGLHILEQLSAQWTPGELAGLDTASAFVDPLIDEAIVANHPITMTPAFIDKSRDEIELP